MKNTLLFTYSTNIPVRLLTVNMKIFNSYPKNTKMCNPILVTLLKMQPHYSQSSPENATLSSGTSPLPSFKEVPRGTSSTKNHCMSNKNNHQYPLSVVKTQWQRRKYLIAQDVSRTSIQRRVKGLAMGQRKSFVLPRTSLYSQVRYIEVPLYDVCLSSPPNSSTWVISAHLCIEDRKVKGW